MRAISARRRESARFSRGASEVEAVEKARSAIRAYLWVAQVLAADRATVRLEISA